MHDIILENLRIGIKNLKDTVKVMYYHVFYILHHDFCSPKNVNTDQE